MKIILNLILVFNIKFMENQLIISMLNVKIKSIKLIFLNKTKKKLKMISQIKKKNLKNRRF